MKYRRLTALILSASLLLSGCSGMQTEQKQVYTDTLFDTVVRIEILDNADEDVLKGCENICKKYQIGRASCRERV